MEPLVITCNQFNVNDNSYKVLDIYFSNGDKVKRYDTLFSLDSSKAVLDIDSEGDGFFYTNIKVGQDVEVGQPLYVITKEATESNDIINRFFINQNSAENKQETKFSKVVTKGARKLLSENHLSESDFSDEVITEDVVKRYLDFKEAPSLILNNANHGKVKKIAFIGAGQGLVQVLDIVFHSNEFIPSMIYDDTPQKQGLFVFNIPVAGPVNFDNIARDFQGGKFDVIVNTVSTSISFRKKVFDTLTALGIPFANLIHPTVYIGFNNEMGTGNVILPHVSIGPCTQIGNDNFLSAKCNIEHHNLMGDHCTFGPGVMTSGNVILGSEIKFGTGIFIEPKVTIHASSVIASGCIINRDVAGKTLAYLHGSKLSFKSIEN